jgi:RES domain-containing protein
MAARRTRRALNIYRIARAIHPLFDGTGAARFGARWTSPGRKAIYAAGSYAGALMEVLAHAQRRDLKVAYHCLVIGIPAGVRIIELDPKDLPGWDSSNYTVSREFGDHWLNEAKTALLSVPSITGRPHELNFIINPDHQDVSELQLAKPHAVIWDERLISNDTSR